ncbi:unnamed protein product [Rhodiola kirilowii]
MHSIDILISATVFLVVVWPQAFNTTFHQQVCTFDVDNVWHTL